MSYASTLTSHGLCRPQDGWRLLGVTVSIAQLLAQMEQLLPRPDRLRLN